MPITFAIDQERRLVRSKVEGAIAVNDILAHVEAIRGAQALPFSEIIDANAATAPYPTPAEIWRAAGAVEALKLPPPLGPRAVIASHDVIFGLARIFANRVWGNLPVQVFRNLESAEEWLAKKSKAPNPGPSPQST